MISAYYANDLMSTYNLSIRQEFLKLILADTMVMLDKIQHELNRYSATYITHIWCGKYFQTQFKFALIRTRV